MNYYISALRNIPDIDRRDTFSIYATCLKETKKKGTVTRSYDSYEEIILDI